MHPRRSVTALAATAATILAGAAGAVAPSPAAAAAPTGCAAMSTTLRQRINPKTHGNLLTQWSAEAKKAKRLGFAKTVPTGARVSNRPATGLRGVHLLYRPANHDFRYVTSAALVRQAKRAGYVDQGIRFYAATASSACTTPVYRYVRRGMSGYASTVARRHQLAAAGWVSRGAAFYARNTTAHASPVTRVKTVAKSASSTSASISPRGSQYPSPPPAGWGGGPGPLADAPYLSTSTQAWHAYKAATDKRQKELFYQLAATPTTSWLGGAGSDRRMVDNLEKSAAAAHRTPYLVLYAIPGRDCGGYSAGGLSGPTAYKRWVDSVRAGIANRPTVVIVEPDAIGMRCLSPAKKAQRIDMLSYAMSTLSRDPKTFVYVHAGSAGLNTDSVAGTLKSIAIAKARGFVLNVSGYDSTASEEHYGDALVNKLAQRGIPHTHYLIDTSRNGLGRPAPGSTGSAPSWCNPPGRAAGARPTTRTGNPNVDAWIWVKSPGGSDGQCHRGDPKHWFPQRAAELTQRALDHKIITKLALPANG